MMTAPDLPQSREPPPEKSAPSSLQALAKIATRLGLDVNVEQMKRHFALDAGEPDTSILIALARELGLEARAVTLRFDELPRLSRALPAILRAKTGGALILEDARTDPAKGTVAVIRDPCSVDDAVLAIDELHLAEVWEGEAILFKGLIRSRTNSNLLACGGSFPRFFASADFLEILRLERLSARSLPSRRHSFS